MLGLAPTYEASNKFNPCKFFSLDWIQYFFLVAKFQQTIFLIKKSPDSILKVPIDSQKYSTALKVSYFHIFKSQIWLSCLIDDHHHITYVQSEKRNTGFDPAKFEFPLYLMTKPSLLYKNKQIIVWENAQNALRNALHKILFLKKIHYKYYLVCFKAQLLQPVT
jgi:predicted P-loop ATPase/GTPase